MSDVDNIISSIDVEMVNIIEFIKTKHEEFEAKFSVMRTLSDKTKRIDPSKVTLALAMYPDIASWYLSEYQIASARESKMREAYDVWYSQRSPVAEAEMKKSGEHVTQKTIQAKVALLWPADNAQWSKVLLEAKVNKDLLEKRLDIIHDSRYTLSATSTLRNIWDTNPHRDGSMPYDPAEAINEADKQMQGGHA